MRVYFSPSTQNLNLFAFGGTSEEAQAWRIAVYAKEALERTGHQALLPARGSSMQQAVAASNAWGAGLHVCVHTNAGGGKGVEVLASRLNQENKFVKAVYAELDIINPNPGRGIKVRTDLYEIYATNAVAIYCECEFHDNVPGAKWIIDNALAIGEAIARGICLADGQAFKPAGDPPGLVQRPRRVRYRAHVEGLGWLGWVADSSPAGTTGQSRRLEAVELALAEGISGGIEAEAHVQDIGWMDWSEGLVGTTGQSRRLEALRIRLTGEAADGFSVYYRVHVQNHGWLGWARDGAAVGTVGRALRAEAVEVMLAPAGEPGPDGAFI